MAHAAQPVSLAHAHNSTRLRDSVRQATSQVQRRSRDVGGSPERPCLARGDCCPPGKGCNRASPSSRDEAGVLQPLLHRTQERWWPSANPGSASLEPGFTQAPVQDADAQAHDQMHSAPGLVCSDRFYGLRLPPSGNGGYVRNLDDTSTHNLTQSSDIKQHQNCVTLWNKMLTNEDVIMIAKLWGADWLHLHFDYHSESNS